MEYIMITFKAEAMQLDLQLPTCITSRELLLMLGEALGIELDANRKIQVEPLGRILADTVTLEAEGVSHGALLTLV